MSTFERIRSGLPGLDSMLDSIRMGDNVVWQVSSMDDYMHFVTPLCNQLHEEGKELLYMHFSGHPALLQAGNGIRVYEFDPSEGFEAFTMNVGAGSKQKDVTPSMYLTAFPTCRLHGLPIL